MTARRLKLISLFCIAAMVTIIGCKRKPQSSPAEPNNPGHTEQQQTTPSASDTKPTLREIIARARGWGPTFSNWIGQEAPDFTVTDINGKKHTLSEYRGKNVLLNFWATWCPPCIIEIPHLVELRNTYGENKLAILAISYIDFRNKPETIKKFVASKPNINYTVTATDIRDMPGPYNLINSIPFSIFITPEGRIKLATEGLIGFSDTNAIIEAER